MATRIEALTAIVNQTVAKVDRLTASSSPNVTNGAHPSTTTAVNSGSVKAVASKLLSRATESPPKLSSPLAAARRPGKIDVTAVVNAAKLSPQQGQIPPPVKNRAAAGDKPAAALANSTTVSENKLLAEEKTITTSAAANVATETTATNASLEKESSAGEIATSAVSSVKAVEGILKKKVEGSPEVANFPPPSPRDRSVERTLRPEAEEQENTSSAPSPPSILKRRPSHDGCLETLSEPAQELPTASTLELPPHPSILKRPSSRGESADSSRSISPDPVNSILKRPGTAPSGGAAVHSPPLECGSPSGGSSCGDPRPILKKRSSTEDFLNDPRPILKKKSSTDDEHEGSAQSNDVSKPKPILKSGRRVSCEQLDVDVPPAPPAHRPPRRPIEFREVNAPEAGGQADTVEEEARQLSVAERIELHKQNVAAAGRQPVRANSADSTGGGPPKMRCSVVFFYIWSSLHPPVRPSVVCCLGVTFCPIGPRSSRVCRMSNKQRM